MGLFKWIRRVISSAGRTHEMSSIARPPVKAEGRMAVRRFQGRFECGCTWPVDELRPDECPRHPGSEPVYLTIREEQMTNVQVLAFPDDIQEA